MNGFQTDDPFSDVVTETNRMALKHELRMLEKRHFPTVPPIVDIEIGDADGPAKLTPDRRIVIDSAAANWPRVRKLLILHELVHNARIQSGDQNYKEHDFPMEAEIRRLWDEDAYTKLL